MGAGILDTAFCFGLAEIMSFEMGSPSSQIAQHLNKTSFLLHQQLPQEFGFCGSKPQNTLFCLVIPYKVKLCKPLLVNPASGSE